MCQVQGSASSFHVLGEYVLKPQKLCPVHLSLFYIFMASPAAKLTMSVDIHHLLVWHSTFDSPHYADTILTLSIVKGLCAATISLAHMLAILYRPIKSSCGSSSELTHLIHTDNCSLFEKSVHSS